jgi:uncharacterized protein (DUF488 family)
MKLFTIGFTHKSAEVFFTALKDAKVKRLIDIRLKNRSQLSGFAKSPDLAYFLREIGGIDYEHWPEWAPTAAILDGYRKKRMDWPEYERRFRALMKERGIERQVCAAELDHACLLCSEALPAQCHRRLVAEYLQDAYPSMSLCHL